MREITLEQAQELKNQYAINALADLEDNKKVINYLNRLKEESTDDIERMDIDKHKEEVYKNTPFFMENIYKDGSKNIKSNIMQTLSNASGSLGNYNFAKSLLGDEEAQRARAKVEEEVLKSMNQELKKMGVGFIGKDEYNRRYFVSNTGETQELDDNVFMDLWRGVKTNAFEVGGSLVGGLVGSKFKPILKAFPGAKKYADEITAGTIGAMLGSDIDYTRNAALFNKEPSFNDRLANSATAGLLNVGGDLAVLGGAKALSGVKNSFLGVKDGIKTGSAVGKDMIDGIAVKGNRVIDKISQKDIPIVGKFSDGGLQNAETIFNNLTKNVENKAQIDELILKENPIYLENGKPTIEILKNLVEQGLNKNNPQFIQDSAKRTSAILKNISNALSGYPTTQRREILLKAAQAYPEIGSFLDDVLKADKDASISFLNIVKEQDEVFKNKTGLSGEFDVKAWQKDNSSYKKRINNEYAQAIKSIDELNNGSIRLSKEDLAKIEEFKNNNFLEQDIKTNISSFLEDAIDKDLSAEQIFNLRSAINKQLATGNKTYNTKEAYRLVKDTLDETMIKNASDKELARKILEDANKNYALKENFNNSYLGKIKDQETPEALAQRIANGARNINEDKDLKRAFEGMNEAERKANEKHVFNALLAKHRIEDIGYDFKSLAKDMDNVEFVSKDLKYAKEVVNVYAKIYQNNKDLIMTALASSGKKTNSSIATTFSGVFDRILISGVFARLHALAPFMKSAKEQALRNQILDALKLAKTNKQIIKNLKNIKISNPEQSKIFKDALDNYIKVDKEQNKILKDTLIKEGLIKGDNFYMDKPDPKYAKSDYTAKFNVEKWINNVTGILKDEWVVNLKAMAKKHPEMFKNEADVFRVIKEIKDNPTHFFKNYDDEVALIAKPLKDNKVGNIAIKKDSGKIIHINKTKDKDLERLNRRNKEMLTGTPTPATTKGSTTNVEGGLLQHSFKHSTQDKPKENLIEKLKEDRKNKKSVKEKLDEKIKNQKESDENKWKRFDNFLKENKDYNLDVMGNLDVVTREFILNAKKKTHKGKKADIPDLMRSKIENELNIKPLKEFGKNYAEYYHDGKGALQKLLIEKQGQVAGAFHRKDLGDIDLVWGEVTDKIKHKGYGLAHIIDKHPDFYVKMIDEIVEKGEVKKSHNGFNIIYKDYRLGLNEGWNEKGQKIGNNKWVVTAFEKI
ncbi:hypothetical protein ACSKW8_000932 [Campylobacter lari]|uniref:putative barnase/colicin E5 family endoribonuclease n=1 Tax=Campylobacter lari TaxID=201 RepID=UPI002149DB8D|nr:hypothetical protein [Campylobacter lari]EHC7929189.1 hypothetical protein [Campylobacter lari]MCR2079397.1 hypothetical protein [Campylobacter lari subsp. concheus]